VRYNTQGRLALGPNWLFRLKGQSRVAVAARKHLQGGETGQSMVEFALILLPLLMIIFGIIKFGILFGQYTTLTNATSYGARTLAVNRGAGTGPPTACSLADTALDSAATTLSTSNITISITFPSPDTSTCTALVAGDAASVQATYPCDLQILFLNVWPSCTLVAQTTVRIE
jgi:Flp pilus assembly protein TadG